jgi:hypothetical protein
MLLAFPRRPTLLPFYDYRIMLLISLRDRPELLLRCPVLVLLVIARAAVVLKSLLQAGTNRF